MNPFANRNDSQVIVIYKLSEINGSHTKNGIIKNNCSIQKKAKKTTKKTRQNKETKNRWNKEKTNSRMVEINTLCQ